MDTYRFGLVSDTHTGSKHQQLTALHLFYDECQKQRISRVFHVGDATAGLNTYRGQAEDLHIHTPRGHVDYLADKYPRRKGIVTEFILGNHDETMLKNGGVDPLELVTHFRDDIKYLGKYAVDVTLPNGMVLHMIHPDGGTSETKMKNYVNALTSLPNILAMGHLHHYKNEERRGVDCYMMPCFEAQTTFMQRKGLVPTIGGLILTVKASNNSVKTDVEKIFFNAMENDY